MHGLPLTYEECRARFGRVVAGAGLSLESHAIAARGPNGAELAIDVTQVGSDAPARALVVLSGVHGVEGFVSSALQCDLLNRLESTSLPGDMAVLVVHAVNPWGMAWWRRQNESNVDLNRNWQRDEIDPPVNEAYEELHALACPDSDDLPGIEDLLVAAQAMVESRGLVWVRDGITVGQYRHPDGLHFGGSRTEESNQILEALIPARLGRAGRVLTVDLHTGHGPPAELTALCDQPPGSPQHRFLQQLVDRVEATADNPDATTGLKRGQIANGFADVLPAAQCYATSLEVGTADDLTQLGATYQEQWVHRHGDRSDPAHAAAVWRYRTCFTPDDRAWETAALERGAAALDRAVESVARWG